MVPVQGANLYPNKKALSSPNYDEPKMGIRAVVFSMRQKRQLDADHGYLQRKKIQGGSGGELTPFIKRVKAIPNEGEIAWIALP